MDATIQTRFSTLDSLLARGEQIASGMADDHTESAANRLAGRCGRYHSILDQMRVEIAKLRVAVETRREPDDDQTDDTCPSCSGTGCARHGRRPDDGATTTCRHCKGAGRV